MYTTAIAGTQHSDGDSRATIRKRPVALRQGMTATRELWANQLLAGPGLESLYLVYCSPTASSGTHPGGCP
jgi:hypothetical protein